MSEHEVHKKYYSCEDDRSHHHNNSRTLKLVPRRPADLLGKFFVRLFYVNRYFAHFLIFVGLGWKLATCRFVKMPGP